MSMAVTDDYTRLEHFVVGDITSSNASITGFWTDADNILIDGCGVWKLKTSASATDIIVRGIYAIGAVTVVNCSLGDLDAINTKDGGSAQCLGITVGLNDGQTTSVFNNAIEGLSTNTNNPAGVDGVIGINLSGSSGLLECINNAVGTLTGGTITKVCINQAGGSTKDVQNNATTDTSGGTNSQDNITPADEFVDITPATMDLHMKAGGQCWENGIDLITGGYTDAPTEDCDNRARPDPGTWSIGIDHYLVYDETSTDGVLLNGVALDSRPHNLQTSGGLAVNGIYATNVVGRHIFYGGSSFGEEIPTSKEALLPTGTATFANYISYHLGIVGLFIDIADLADSTSITASDFTFTYGNNSSPDSWTSATAPTSVTVDEGAGVDGSDRIKIEWATSAIPNSNWLQVTVLANASTGLAYNDVFYWGWAIGDTGDSTTDAIVDIDDADAVQANIHPFQSVTVDNVWDIDKSGKVLNNDVALVTSNYTTEETALQLITPPELDGIDATDIYVAYNPPAIGGAVVNSTADETFRDVFETSGGIFVNGVVVNVHHHKPPISGGILIGGLSTNYITTLMQGGVLVGNIAAVIATHLNLQKALYKRFRSGDIVYVNTEDLQYVPTMVLGFDDDSYQTEIGSYPRDHLFSASEYYHLVGQGVTSASLEMSDHVSEILNAPALPSPSEEELVVSEETDSFYDTQEIREKLDELQNLTPVPPHVSRKHWY
jgi:hypothetical protein